MTTLARSLFALTLTTGLGAGCSHAAPLDATGVSATSGSEVHVSTRIAKDGQVKTMVVERVDPDVVDWTCHSMASMR